MVRKYGLLLVALAVVLATPVLAGHKCSGDAQACLNKMAAELSARGWVGIELDKNEDTGALTVTRVIQDSPAQAAGFKKGDVLVALDGLEFGEQNYEALKAAKKGMTPGKQMTYTVARKGKNRDVAVTLAEVPQEILAQWIGGHMLEDHVTVALAQY